MKSKTIILPGGSGFLGTAMTPYLRAAGYDLIVLTRGDDRESDGIRYVHWDGRTLGPWAVLLDGAAAVVNLAGKSVNCRYTPENRREILSSRVDSVRVIAQAISECDNPPKVWVQAASSAIYGNAGDQLLDENSPPGLGFSPETCIAWERAFNSVDCPRTRRVLLRVGFALGEGGGALQTLSKLARFFLGGSVGSGEQWVSWLHVKDLARIVLWSIERADVEGLYLAVSPHPVRNAEFMRAIRRSVHRPWSPPVPAWAVRVGSWLMGTESELALWGRRCMPRRLLESGFEFEVEHLGSAFEHFAPPARRPKELSSVAGAVSV